MTFLTLSLTMAFLTLSLTMWYFIKVFTPSRHENAGNVSDFLTCFFLGSLTLTDCSFV